MGKLIAIDGLDGSGKGTQTKLLADSLRSLGYSVRTLSFPRHGEQSAFAVDFYLNGGLGANPEDTGAYAASTFFSVDRYLSYRTDWSQDYYSDTVLISDRYTTANAIHQLSKLPQEQWDDFLSWLWDFEFRKLGLPEPDMVIYLMMKPSVSHRLIAERSAETGRKTDIHENNAAYLENSFRAAGYAAGKLGWNTIPCDDGTAPLPIAEIHKRVLALTERLFNTSFRQDD